MINQNALISIIPFPLTVSTIDESGHVLKSADELKAFLGAGRALKELVTAAETIEDVEAIVDDRE